MEILYKSTRDSSKSVSASYAIIKGIAEDGGLFMPDQFPSLEISLEELSKLDYKGVAYEVMKLFFTDFTEEELRYCIEHAYDSKFDTEEIVPMSYERMGFRVPEDISICGFTNGYRAIACDPMLTTIEQRGVKVGEEAADILIGQVEGTIPREKAERRIVRTRLVVRGTTR